MTPANPLLDFSGLPRFDAIQPEHVGPAIDTLLAQAEAAVKAAETVQPVTWTTASRIAAFSVLVAFVHAFAWAVVIALRWAIVNSILVACRYAGMLR